MSIRWWWIYRAVGPSGSRTRCGRHIEIQPFHGDHVDRSGGDADVLNGRGLASSLIPRPLGRMAWRTELAADSRTAGAAARYWPCASRAAVLCRR